MATNLVPNSSLFTTLLMLLATGDEVDTTFMQDLADNTGFNYLGMSGKPRVSYGLTDVNLTATATTTIDFGTDQIDGVADFASANYVVLLQQQEGHGSSNVHHPRVSSRTTGDFVVTMDGPGSSGAAMYFWLAFGV